MKKKHGNTGNSNAEHSLPANVYIHIRVNAATKQEFMAKADRAGMNLSQWVLAELCGSA